MLSKESGGPFIYTDSAGNKFEIPLEEFRRCVATAVESSEPLPGRPEYVFVSHSQLLALVRDAGALPRHITDMQASRLILGLAAYGVFGEWRKHKVASCRGLMLRRDGMRP